MNKWIETKLHKILALSYINIGEHCVALATLPQAQMLDVTIYRKDKSALELIEPIITISLDSDTAEQELNSVIRKIETLYNAAKSADEQPQIISEPQLAVPKVRSIDKTLETAA